MGYGLPKDPRGSADSFSIKLQALPKTTQM